MRVYNVCTLYVSYVCGMCKKKRKKIIIAFEAFAEWMATVVPIQVEPRLFIYGDPENFLTKGKREIK